MREFVRARDLCIGLTLLCVVLVILGLALPKGTLPGWLLVVMVEGGVSVGLLCLILSIRLIWAGRK